jgi:hypothetical protein
MAANVHAFALCRTQSAQARVMNVIAPNDERMAVNTG